jgi:hypothetical protein
MRPAELLAIGGKRRELLSVAATSRQNHTPLLRAPTQAATYANGGCLLNLRKLFCQACVVNCKNKHS